MAAGSQMLELGTPAPPFALTEVTTGEQVTLEDVAEAPVLLVAFLCKHCPYVVHVQEGFAALAREYQARGVAVIGIGSNDPGVSPDDTPEGLAEQKQQIGFEFPYLFDADQSVAMAYHAACTPDFFVFDAARTLAYRGRMDASRPKTDVEVTGADLRAALDALLAGQPAPSEQFPSMGCSIKWAPGNEPA
ncbi:MAG: thioredoxin family protein [Nitriliruptoraceae bacterium]|nr:thioredoxin family protein [Nitriliruptoraceae bacterium]